MSDALAARSVLGFRVMAKWPILGALLVVHGPDDTYKTFCLSVNLDALPNIPEGFKSKDEER